jgi:single-stranded-DNA-specific exonuclease
MPAFLSVERSLTGRRWTGPSLEQDRVAEALARDAAIPLPVARLLAARGVTAPEAASHLDPKLRDLLPDPRSLRDMPTAAARLVAAVTRGQRIAIFADYDVDGASSAALLLTWLRALGRPATLYVPDRIDEGYGPNVPAMQTLGRAHDLIVCVDCGTLSHEPVAAAGTDVVILDHHLGAETLPPALAIVNPNRQDESGALGHLCAAGVTFLTLVEANRLLRAEGLAQPDLMGLLDLVALATVAEVAPLTGVNRAFVRTGLSVMALRDRPGLVALSDAAGLDRAPDTYHLGYILGPRVNAGGRIGRADLGARLLSTTNPTEAAQLAAELDRLNADRRSIDAAVRAEALAQAESRGTNGPLVWAAGEGWHPGVVGIVASALKEATNRPAVVIGLDGDIGKGSARSVTGIDLGAAIHRVAAEGLLLKGGGHKMAAGLTVERAKLPAAMERLAELLERQGAGDIGPADLPLDGLLMPEAATVDLVTALDRAGPFGAGAPAPRFAFPAVMIHAARILNGGHLKLTFGDGMGRRLDAIAFGAAEGPLGLTLLRPDGARFHLAGRIETNHWQGRQTVQLKLEDASPAT